MATNPSASDKVRRSERDQQRVAALLWQLKGSLSSFIENLGYKTIRTRIYSSLVEATKTHDTKSVIEHVAKAMARCGNCDPVKNPKVIDASLDATTETYRTRAEAWYLENQETIAEVFMALSSGVTLPVSESE